jgi:hypothetical protein
VPVTFDFGGLLGQARRQREQATRCRAILKDMSPDDPATAQIAEYAADVERRVEDLERLCPRQDVHAPSSRSSGRAA